MIKVSFFAEHGALTGFEIKGHSGYAESDEDDENRRAKPRHIYIDSIKTYCLEEVDLPKEHRQDNRSWSEKGKNSGKNNGRLMISDKFREEHKMPYKYISYQNTFAQLTNLVETNV